MQEKRQETQTLPRDALRRLRAVEDALAHYSLDGDNLLASLEALRELVDTDKIVLYDLTQRPDSDDLMVGREYLVGIAPGTWRTVFDKYLAGRGVAWGTFNPIHPEIEQRDRVFRTEEIAELTEGRVHAVQMAAYQALDIAGAHMMRALVCDGPSMLGWLGILQPDDTTERQRGLLTRVLPPLRKRLVFERLVGESAVAGSAVSLALEHINGPAWLVGPAGRIGHANSAGRARLDADRTGTRAALAACATGVPDPRFKVTPLRDAGGSNAGHLVVELLDGTPRALAHAARRFNLTPAQTRVLERVARGASNAKIAAELGVAERTVEAHVTAILVKAQVPSRSALIVQIYADSRSH